MGEHVGEWEGLARESPELGICNSSTWPLRKKKKLLREQRKQRERVELKMDLPGVSIADEGETGMFSLRTIRGHQVRQGGAHAGDGRTCVGIRRWGPGGLWFSMLNDLGSWLLSSPINDLVRGGWEKTRALYFKDQEGTYT